MVLRKEKNYLRRLAFLPFNHSIAVRLYFPNTLSCALENAPWVVFNKTVDK